MGYKEETDDRQRAYYDETIDIQHFPFTKIYFVNDAYERGYSYKHYKLYTVTTIAQELKLKLANIYQRIDRYMKSGINQHGLHYIKVTREQIPEEFHADIFTNERKTFSYLMTPEGASHLQSSMQTKVRKKFYVTELTNRANPEHKLVKIGIGVDPIKRVKSYFTPFCFVTKATFIKTDLAVKLETALKKLANDAGVVSYGTEYFEYSEEVNVDKIIEYAHIFIDEMEDKWSTFHPINFMLKDKE